MGAGITIDTNAPASLETVVPIRLGFDDAGILRVQNVPPNRVQIAVADGKDE